MQKKYFDVNPDWLPKVNRIASKYSVQFAILGRMTKTGGTTFALYVIPSGWDFPVYLVDENIPMYGIKNEIRRILDGLKKGENIERFISDAYHYLG